MIERPLLGSRHSGSIRYQITCIALCIENSRDGRILRSSLAQIAVRAPDCIQFGSADWFWEQCVNTDVLQVEPVRHEKKDEVGLDAKEAHRVQEARDLFFRDLKGLLAMQ